MTTSELLNDHQDALKEEGMITELRQKLRELSVTREVATKKINQLLADLDPEVVVQSSWENEVELLRSEFRERKTLQAQLLDV